jgi:hypothetical protein
MSKSKNKQNKTMQQQSNYLQGQISAQELSTALAGRSGTFSVSIGQQQLLVSSDGNCITSVQALTSPGQKQTQFQIRQINDQALSPPTYLTQQMQTRLQQQQSQRYIGTGQGSTSNQQQYAGANR